MQIRLEKISKIFDPKSPNSFQALYEIDAKFIQGEFIAIIGPTGSGKTTLIEHLNLLSLPSSGSIFYKSFFSDYKAKKDKKTKKYPIIETELKIVNTKRKIKHIKEIRKNVGVVFQFAEYQLFEKTIEKDIAFGPISMGENPELALQKAKEYLDLVGLPPRFLEQSPFELSGGQKRRVALAGILAMEPDFLVLDEPTAGLDPQGTKEMLEIFDKIQRNGKTVIIVTHNLDHVLEYTKRTLFLKEGKLIRDGDSYEILKDVKFLLENELEPPKLLLFIDKLEQRGIHLGEVKSLEQLTNKINEFMKSKSKKENEVK